MSERRAFGQRPLPPRPGDNQPHRSEFQPPQEYSGFASTSQPPFDAMRVDQPPQPSGYGDWRGPTSTPYGYSEFRPPQEYSGFASTSQQPFDAMRGFQPQQQQSGQGYWSGQPSTPYRHPEFRQHQDSSAFASTSQQPFDAMRQRRALPGIPEIPGTPEIPAYNNPPAYGTRDVRLSPFTGLPRSASTPRSISDTQSPSALIEVKQEQREVTLARLTDHRSLYPKQESQEDIVMTEAGADIPDAIQTLHTEIKNSERHIKECRENLHKYEKQLSPFRKKWAEADKALQIRDRFLELDFEVAELRADLRTIGKFTTEQREFISIKKQAMEIEKTNLLYNKRIENDVPIKRPFVKQDPQKLEEIRSNAMREIEYKELLIRTANNDIEEQNRLIGAHQIKLSALETKQSRQSRRKGNIW